MIYNNLALAINVINLYIKRNIYFIAITSSKEDTKSTTRKTKNMLILNVIFNDLPQYYTRHHL